MLDNRIVTNDQDIFDHFIGEDWNSEPWKLLRVHLEKIENSLCSSQFQRTFKSINYL